MKPSTNLITGVGKCNACGQSHTAIEFIVLEKPETIADVEYWWVGYCPVTGFRLYAHSTDNGIVSWDAKRQMVIQLNSHGQTVWTGIPTPDTVSGQR